MIKHLLLTACVTGICIRAAYSQDQKVVDSLRTILDDRVDGDRFLPLYNLAFQYIQRDNGYALSVINEAEQAALLSGDSLWIVKSMRVKGQLLYFMEDNDEARRIFELVLPVSVRNGFKQEELYIEGMLGKLHLFFGNYDEALSLFFSTVNLARGMENTTELSFALHYVGLGYYKLKDYSKALDYFRQSLSLKEFDGAHEPFMFANIGLCYAYLGDFVNAQDYVEQSLRYCGSACDIPNLINIEYAFGVIAFKQKRLAAAEKHFLNSYRTAESVDNTRFMLDNICLLVELYLARQQIEEARTLLIEAEELISRHPPFNLELIKIYSRFYDYFIKTKNFEKASFYQARYIDLKDSVYDADLTTNLMRLEAEYLERENMAKIQAQDSVISLNAKVISHQRLLIIISAVLASLALVLFFLLLHNHQRRKNLNQILERKVKERTLELESIRQGLLRGMHEKELQLSRVSGAIIHTVGTIEGLCVTGAREDSVDVARSYFGKIRQTADRLSENYHVLLEERR